MKNRQIYTHRYTQKRESSFPLGYEQREPFEILLAIDLIVVEPCIGRVQRNLKRQSFIAFLLLAAAKKFERLLLKDNFFLETLDEVPDVGVRSDD